MNIHAHKKKLAAVLVLGTAAAIGVSLLIPGKPDEEVVREREYTVTRDTITVGVESSGQISAVPYAHSLEAGTQIEELLVKVGSEVKKGDPLASLSTEDLNEQLQAAQDEVSDAEAALLQATSARDVRVAQNNKDKQDGLDGVKQNYDSQIEQLTSEKKRLETAVSQQESTLAQLRQQSADAAAQAGELEQKIQALQETINQNVLEIGRLNEELLKMAGSSASQDESSAAGDETAIRLKITELQNQNTAMQQEIDGYKADPVFVEWERLKTEQQACETSLATDREALALKQGELERTQKQYQQALDNQDSDNAFSDYQTGEDLKTLEENIAQAHRAVQTAQDTVARLQALIQNPVLYSQLDGVVTALNYKAGDTILEGKPLCVVGQLGQITITVPVSAADIGSVSVGQRVNLYVDAYAEQKFTGTVSERLLVANDNGEYPVTISLDPGEQTLLPGMKAYATIILKEKVDVLTLSNKAITLENGRQYVLVRDENGELEKREIVTGFSDGRVSEILDGLAENETVVVQE